jgi:hypothetical protein
VVSVDQVQMRGLTDVHAAGNEPVGMGDPDEVFTGDRSANIAQGRAGRAGREQQDREESE